MKRSFYTSTIYAVAFFLAAILSACAGTQDRVADNMGKFPQKPAPLPPELVDKAGTGEKENAVPDVVTAPEDAPSLPHEFQLPDPEGSMTFIPQAPSELIGSGVIDSETLALFLCATNPTADLAFVKSIADIYRKESATEGINSDVAFAQMCLETGFLAFGGDVKPDMNNFCGLGSIGPEAAGERFASPEIGIRAQIQHLKAYATDAPMKNPLVDPRHKYVKYGSAPTIFDLAGTWAADRDYGKKIKSILDRLYLFNFSRVKTVA
jgi:hypothetical protein